MVLQIMVNMFVTKVIKNLRHFYRVYYEDRQNWQLQSSLSFQMRSINFVCKVHTALGDKE